jgi:hypothetical protein
MSENQNQATKYFHHLQEKNNLFSCYTPKVQHSREDFPHPANLILEQTFAPATKMNLSEPHQPTPALRSHPLSGGAGGGSRDQFI